MKLKFKHINSKKSQFFVFSAFLISLSLFVIYSLETSNYFKTQNLDLDIQTTIEYQFCEHISLNKGLNLSNSFTDFKNNVEQSCSIIDHTCDVNLYIFTQPPLGDLTLLNYTHMAMNYSISFGNELTNKTEIRCVN